MRWCPCALLVFVFASVASCGGTRSTSVTPDSGGGGEAELSRVSLPDVVSDASGTTDLAKPLDVMAVADFVGTPDEVPVFDIPSSPDAWTRPDVPPPPDRCEGPFGSCPALVVRTYTTLAGADIHCCHDYTGDGVPDNGIGRLVRSQLVDGGEADLNVALEESLANGFLIVLELVGLDDARDDDSFRINVYLGDSLQEDAGAVPDVVIGGDRDGDGDPVPVATLPARVVDGRFEAGEGSFLMPGIERLLVIHWFPLAQVYMRGEMVSDEDGVSLRYVWFGGLIEPDSMLPKWNRWIREDCPCLVIPEPGDLFVQDEQGAYVCAEPVTGGECEESNEDCLNVGGACPMILSVAASEVADIDANEELDGNEALSIGGRIEAFPARIVTP